MLSKEVGELYATKTALLEREEAETMEALEENVFRATLLYVLLKRN
ncbi:MAG: hypothetical protein ACLRRA_05310 [Acutalibacteraceae bacterium]